MNDFQLSDFKEKEQKSPEFEVVNETPFDPKLPYVLLDIDEAKKGFVQLKSTMNQLIEAANLLRVEDKQSNEQANQMLIQCRQITKAVAKAKETMSEYKKAATFKNNMDKFIRELFTANITKIEKQILAPKISQFHKAEAEIARREAEKKAKEEAERQKAEFEKAEKERIEREKKEREEALARQAKLDQQAKDADVEPVQIEIPEVDEQIKVPDETEFQPPVLDSGDQKVQTDAGSATIKSKWVCKIINSDKVPREYCVPDQKLLNNAVKSGIRNISGCEINEEFESRVRVKSTKTSDDMQF